MLMYLGRIVSSAFQPAERNKSLVESISTADKCTAKLIDIIQAECEWH